MQEWQSVSIPREMRAVRKCTHGRKGRMLREDTDEETGGSTWCIHKADGGVEQQGWGRKEGILQASSAELGEFGSHVWFTQ